jgi:trehalose 6-phosphate synthase
VPKARGAAGAQGGLAGALNSALRKHSGVWFGWSGQESEESQSKQDFYKKGLLKKVSSR